MAGRPPHLEAGRQPHPFGGAMKKALAVVALLAAGIATSVALTTATARASYGLTDLGALGYTMYAVGVNQSDFGQFISCTMYYAEGNGSPRTLIGSTDVHCTDPSNMQRRIDALVAAYPPPSPPPSTTVAPAATTAPAVTTAAPPATTAPAPAPAPPVTTTVAATLPAPPYADFDAKTTNPNVVTFVDKTTGANTGASRTWQYGDGKSSNATNATHVYPGGAGSYYVTLIVIDTNGLSSLAGHWLTIFADRSIALGPRVTQAVATKKPVAKKPHVKKVTKKKR